MLTIHELFAQYLASARRTYLRNPSEVVHSQSLASCLAAALDAETLVADFGPRALKRVRESMVAGGWPLASGTAARPWCRQYVNAQVRRLVRIFAWAVSEELAPVAAGQPLPAVSPLARGRAGCCREGKGHVMPAEPASVSALLASLKPVLADMVWLQCCSAMRSGEMCQMRPCDLRTGTEPWEYHLRQHKPDYRDQDGTRGRVVMLGPQAVEIIQRNLPLDTRQKIWPYSSPRYPTAICGGAAPRG